MPSVRSTPLAQTCSSSTRISDDSARVVTALASRGSRPRWAASRVIARYISPLSTNGRRSFSAALRPTADLPEATPPSIAMIILEPSLPYESDGPPEGFDLRLPQHTPSARLQAPELERPEGHATQGLDAVADGEQHPPHLPVATLANHHPKLGVPRVSTARCDADQLHLGRRRDAVIELHAAAQRVQVRGS